MFEGRIVRRFGHDAEVVFPWLVWVESFPRWFTLCRGARLVDGQSESEGSVYEISVSLGPMRTTTRMRIDDLDEDARSFRFVRADPGNVVEMSYAVAPEPSGCTITFGARYEGSGRILGVPVGGGLFTGIIERSIDRSLPRLSRLIDAEGR